MNQRYFELPVNKQNNLINAGYKLFSLYPYKKASMGAIADEAAISKSLLFYYFKNKKEYYLYLFETAVEFVNEKKVKNTTGNKYDLFELINFIIEQRMKLLHDYPYLYRFISRAYYEEFEEVKLDIDEKKKLMTQTDKEEILSIIEHDRFKNPGDIKPLINIILYLAEGCMRGREDLDIAKMHDIIREFRCMMESLKNHYYKEKYLGGVGYGAFSISQPEL